jgi:hypothetical protein
MSLGNHDVRAFVQVLKVCTQLVNKASCVLDPREQAWCPEQGIQGKLFWVTVEVWLTPIQHGHGRTHALGQSSLEKDRRRYGTLVQHYEYKANSAQCIRQLLKERLTSREIIQLDLMQAYSCDGPPQGGTLGVGSV